MKKNHQFGQQLAGFSRREMLRTTAAGFGSVALAGLLSDQVSASEKSKQGPLAPKAPHFHQRPKESSSSSSKVRFRSSTRGSTSHSFKLTMEKRGRAVVPWLPPSSVFTAW